LARARAEKVFGGKGAGKGKGGKANQQQLWPQPPGLPDRVSSFELWIYVRFAVDHNGARIKNSCVRCGYGSALAPPTNTALASARLPAPKLPTGCRIRSRCSDLRLRAPETMVRRRCREARWTTVPPHLQEPEMLVSWLLPSLHSKPMARGIPTVRFRRSCDCCIASLSASEVGQRPHP
jgi:hypothetical protein